MSSTHAELQEHCDASLVAGRTDNRIHGPRFFRGLGNLVIPANGGPIRSLTHDDQAKGYPDWSPDGQQIVFSDVPPVSLPRGIYI